ncbi:MAG: peptidoglycan DD-metalloendopeptidase family protein [Actinomycetota bacterium]
MASLRIPRGLLLLLVVTLLAIVPLGASAQTEKDVDRAEDKVERAQEDTSRAEGKWAAAQDELEDALLELDKITSEIDNLTYTIGLLESRVSSYEGDADDLRDIAQQLVLEAYTSGGRGIVTAAFEAGSIQDLLTSQQLMNSAASRDIADLDRLQAVSREMDRLKLDLVDKREEVKVLETEAAVYAEKADSLAGEAKAAYDNASAYEKRAIENLRKERNELKAAEALKKQQQVAASNSRSGSAGGLAPAATPGFNCPVLGGASFIDSWGFPRSGGRTHKGVDMFNKRDTPLIAVVDGRVKFSSNSLGGLSTHLYADDGTVYYYAHLERHPTNISSGQRVSAGTVVGFLGNSGNARYTSPHLHFEIRPGGRAVNPYPTVRSYCP